MSGCVLLVEGLDGNDAIVVISPGVHVEREQLNGLIPLPWVGIGEITPGVVQQDLNLEHGVDVVSGMVAGKCR